MDGVDSGNENGCLTAGGGLWYKLGSSFGYNKYRFSTGLILQLNYGLENWDNQMHKVQGVIIPKVGSRLSLPISITKYNWNAGDTQTVEEITFVYNF